MRHIETTGPFRPTRPAGPFGHASERRDAHAHDHHALAGVDDPRPTAPLRAEHVAMLEHIEKLRTAARAMPGLSDDERLARRAAVLRFLRGTLLPHAEAEERVVYPAWSGLMGAANAAAPMVHDHEQIVAHVERLEAATPSDVDTLQELLYGLYALITAHFRKEEDLQLPAFDAAPEVTQRVLERLPGHH